MAGKPRYTVKQVTDALNACNGLVYLAAERLGCDADTVTNYMNRHPSIREAVLEKRGRRVDIAEAKLDAKVLEGDMRAIEFMLRTIGRNRGYQDRVEHSGTIIFAQMTDEQLETTVAQRQREIADLLRRVEGGRLGDAPPQDGEGATPAFSSNGHPTPG